MTMLQRTARLMFRDGVVEGEVDVGACQKAGVKVLTSLNALVAVKLNVGEERNFIGLEVLNHVLE